MDSRIIDVAIGLVLVFALTSLLVATLVEGIATLRKQRGRVLVQAITSFLGDDQSMTTALLKHPLLVSLAPGTKDEARKPSYIGADVMITSLLSYLTQHYTQGIRPSSPAELVAAVKAGPPPGQTAAAGTAFTPVNLDFQHGLASLLSGVENDWAGYEKRLQAWYDSIGERAGGWYKRWANAWLCAVGFLVAAAANINPIVIGPRLWNDAALREAMVSAGQEASKKWEQQNPQQGTPTQAASMLPAAGAINAAPPKNAPALQALIQQPLPRRVDETEAVADSYAALVKAFADASDVASKNPQDKTAATRQKIFDTTGNLPAELNQTRLPDDNTPDFVNHRALANIAVDRRLAEIKSLIPADASYDAARLQFDKLASAVTKERDALKKKPALKRNRSCDAIDDANAKDFCLRINDLSQLHDAGLPIGWSPLVWPDLVHPDSDAKCLENAAQAGDKEAKQCDHTFHWLNIAAAVGGWLITGIAATLGAPFWFDLLSRLVKLRGTGQRIDGDGSKSGDSTDSKPSMMSTSSTPGADTAQREPMSDALNTQEAALSQSDIEAIQRVLSPFGAALTSTFDRLTREAIRQWQQTRSMEMTGELTQSQIAELLSLKPQGDDYVG